MIYNFSISHTGLIIPETARYFLQTAVYHDSKPNIWETEHTKTKQNKKTPEHTTFVPMNQSFLPTFPSVALYSFTSLTPNFGVLYYSFLFIIHICRYFPIKGLISFLLPLHHSHPSASLCLSSYFDC